MARSALFVLGSLLVVSIAARAQIDCAGPMPGPRTLLKFDRAIFVGTATKYNQHSGFHTFRVTESFKGVTKEYVDVIAFPGSSMQFSLGKQYLVFADSCPWEPHASNCLTTPPCSGTVPLAYAPATIEQLRAEKRGEPVASVYGMLLRALEADLGIWQESYERPLPDVVVRLRTGKKSYEAKTDAHGAYSFHQLPEGKYEVSADLPDHLTLGQRIGNRPVPPFELPPRSSFEYDIYAFPSGRISGSVIGPDGKALHSAGAHLYLLNRYRDGKPGLWSYQGEGRPGEKWKPFEFYHLPPDDYVLVFNPENSGLPDTPFPRTFYPDAADFASSTIIHLTPGQQILKADIHVSNPLPVQRITVRLAWGGREPEEYYPAQVIVEAGTGTPPYPFPAGQDTYTLNLLPRVRYTIRAAAYCRTSTQKTETSAVVVDGSDRSASLVTLTFDKGECTQK
jgi:hypothetical protein